VLYFLLGVLPRFSFGFVLRPDLGDSYEFPPNLLPVVIYSRWDVIMASWWSVQKFCIFPREFNRATRFDVLNGSFTTCETKVRGFLRVSS
jgi:hypothetical protein